MNYSDKLKDPRWQKKRLEVLSRDSFTCQKCGDESSTLHVHHIKYIKGNLPWAYPLTNFVTLCENCHQYEHRPNKEKSRLIVEVSEPEFKSEGKPILKKLNSLERIRQQTILINKQMGNDFKELTEAELLKAWEIYIKRLQEDKKLSAASFFKSAKLNFIDNDSIQIFTENNIQQRFIEAERVGLLEHLQTHFSNRCLCYQVIIVNSRLKSLAQIRANTLEYSIK